ncbi:AbiH family protein [Flavobacterium sp.]|uniref:AbiH family protein n=1 Tax=Flavobacterium sp. TaxID=239 RepID=UPI0039E5541F
MNRLIIIGNGFDLAHGIKTSFNDFVSDYLCNVVNSLLNRQNYKDPLIEVNILEYNWWAFRNPMGNPIDKSQIFEAIEAIINSNNYQLNFVSLLFERIYSKCSSLLWVDIEIEYFNILLATKHEHNDDDQVEAIKKVNDQLDFLKSKLVEYLKKQQLEFGGVKNKLPLLDCFCEEIKSHEIVTMDIENDLLPEKLYFLNFNYTNTIESYVSLCREKIETDYNFIHGDLHENNGKPIFGFGDELDKKYLEFEDEKNNELFKHIKSFEYLRTKNFYLLTRFIESNDFQVHIYGHSCGVSDRTMLSQIFEHKNCKSVKIFYHQKSEDETDFTEKTYEISRHFRDKTMLRRKLVPFALSQSMPQPENLNQ